jgi:hypothetical protein
MATQIKTKKKLPFEGEASKEAMKYASAMIQKYPRLVKYFKNDFGTPYSIARKYLNAEEIFQILCVGYMKEYCPDVVVMHSPNEGKRGNVEKAKISLMGVKSGTSDLLFIYPKKVLHPLFWAELKWDSSVSKEQNEFLENQIKAGHHGKIYKKNLLEFVSDVQEWLKRD